MLSGFECDEFGRVCDSGCGLSRLETGLIDCTLNNQRAVGPSSKDVGSRRSKECRVSGGDRCPQLRHISNPGGVAARLKSFREGEFHMHLSLVGGGQSE
jgi:hypothetical protein